MSKIYYVDGHAGSGKTLQTSHWVVEQACKFNKRIVIATPTTLLQYQWAENINNLLIDIPTKPSILVINSETSDTSARGQLTNAFKEGNANIIIVTQQNLINTGIVKGSNKYHLIMDELPAIEGIDIITASSNESKELIKNSVSVQDSKCASYKIVTCENKSALRKFVDQKGDAHRNDLAVDAFKKIIDNDIDVFIKSSDWSSFYNGEIEQLNLHHIVKPSRFSHFKSVTFMGANFKHSMLFNVWERVYACEFTKSNVANVREIVEEETGRRATIHFLMDEHFSKSKRNLITPEVSSTIFNELVDGKDHIWLANNDVKDSQYTIKNGKRLPIVSHGINSWKDHTTVVHIAALNDKPFHLAFLMEYVGFTSDEIKKAKMSEIIYQGVMRCNLRVRKSDKAVDVYVMDKQTALDLKSYLPGASVKKIAQGTVNDTYKRGKMSSRDTTERHRFKNEFVDHPGIFNEPDIKVSFEETISATCVGEFDTPTFRHFRDFFKSESSNVVSGKDNNNLFSPAIFDSEYTVRCGDEVIHIGGKNKQIKGLAQFKQASVLVFDIDKTKTSPEDVSARIPFKHFIYSSYSNGKDGLYSYRVVVGLKYALDEKNYKLLYDFIYEKFKDIATADVTKRTPVSFFYFPSQSNFGQNVWIDMVDSRSHRLLNPVDIIPVLEEMTTVETNDEIENVYVSTDMTSIQGNLIDRKQFLINQWRGMTHGRHKGFFNFGLGLSYIGVNPVELHSILTTEATMNGRDRSRQIPSIMSSIYRYSI